MPKNTGGGMRGIAHNEMANVRKLAALTMVDMEKRNNT